MNEITPQLGALNGLRVVDLGRIFAAPFCGQLLGDLGADVIRVESRGGDIMRETQPAFGPDLGGYYTTANRNKRSISIDLRKPGGITVLRALLARADVMLENFRPGVLEAMGFDEATLTHDYPRLIAARVSAYGHAGPDRDLPGVDQLVQGVSGFMAITGTEASGPMRAGIAISDIFAGYAACVGVLAALAERSRSGHGQVVHTSLLEALMGSMSVQAGKYFAGGVDPKPDGNFHPVVALYGTFATADGHVQINVMHDRHMASFAKICGKPEWMQDARMATHAGRSQHMDDSRRTAAEVLKTRPTRHWLEALRRADIPCGPILTVAEAFASAQAEAQQMTLVTRTGDGTALKLPGFPVKLARTPPALRHPPPHLGEHSEAILRELGLDRDGEVRAALG